MYIKIVSEAGVKTEVHHAKSYFSNECGGGLDLNIERIDGQFIGERVDAGDKTQIFVMNNDGKTIDRI